MRNIGIIGCAGRMGRKLLEVVHQHPDCNLIGGLEAPDGDWIGKDIGLLIGGESLGIKVTDNAEQLLTKADVVIDFTRPAPTLQIAELAARTGTHHIIGTTGMNEKELATLHEYAKQNVIVHAHNFSVGVNLLMNLVEQAARILPDDPYDIEVVEMHHRNKVDAPSGTALSLGEAAAKGRKIPLKDVARYSREGDTGIRPVGEIGFATLRGGDVIGDHTVMYASPFERVELSHKAQDRTVFAHGAVRAALWAEGKENGLYSMKDVLGL